ncbi:hypothetical protein O3G_MSEX000810 [Manduca sexta]|nr:hypothetical protein O3G_MSEX000810 [Manduca sexta]
MCSKQSICGRRKISRKSSAHCLLSAVR